MLRPLDSGAEADQENMVIDTPETRTISRHS